MTKIKSLITQTGRVCIYCGHPLSEEDATIDHIIPLSRGGLNEPENCVASCAACNTAKGNRMPGSFVSTMRIRQQRGFRNRVGTLHSQGMISTRQRDLLLETGGDAGTSRSWMFNLLGRQVKVWVIVRRVD